MTAHYRRITSSCTISIFLIHLNGLHVYCLKIQSFDLRQIDHFKQALHRTFVLIVTFISLSRNTVYRTIDDCKNILKVRYEPDTLYKRVGIAQFGIQIGKVATRIARRASSHWNRSMNVILGPVNYQPWCTVLSEGEKWMTSSTPTDRAWNIETNVPCANFSSLQTVSYHLHVFRRCLLESFEFSIFAFYF